jgi:beta-lactam-binding protein with PASTA domain
MKSLIRLVLLGLVLIVVALVSALTAMRFAIHGTEVTVPKFVNMTPSGAERAAASLGLTVVIERQYYSADVGEGRVMMQVPAEGTKVRRGYQVRVAESLGPQRVSIPDVLGESGRAAQLNLERRGLDVGGLAYIEMPGIPADQVVAQSPPANASGISMPKIDLLVTTAAQPDAYVMPSFVGQPLGSVNQTLLDAGFHVGSVSLVPSPPPTGEGNATVPAAGTALPVPPQPVPPQPNPASIIVSQNPSPGQKVGAGSAVNFEVR